MGSKRVLVVEDNQQNLDLALYLLKDAGFGVLTAMTLKEARGILAAEVPDLILLDIRLPDGDGLDLAGELRRDPRTGKVPIIAMTAQAMQGDEERILAGGCDAYVSKPISIKDFMAKVREMLGMADPEESPRG